MTLASSTLEWVELAEHDYLAAQTLLQVSKGPLIHDLAKLNRLAQGAHPELKEMEAICELLTPFGTATRYPGSAMTVGPEHMSSVLGWAESIRRFVRDAFGLK